MKVPYGKQNITQDDIDAVVSVLKAELITQGPKVNEFEKQVAKYHNVKHAIAFSNGTTALHAAYHSLGVGTGDEIIAPAITFVASSNGGVYCNAKPVLVDIDLDTNCIDIDAIEKAITSNTKVICPVSLSGYPVDLERIRKIADKHGIKVIHDGAHAIGSRRNNSFQMELADFTMLSFHPVKHVTTGEGGMLLTNDDELAEKARLFRTHGITRDPEKMEIYDGPWSYEMIEIGHNFRMCDIQCALGISQFSRIEENLLNRNLIAQEYHKKLADIEELILPPKFEYNVKDKKEIATTSDLHSYHLFTIRLKDATKRLDFFNYLIDNKIFAQIHYIPVHWHKYYRDNFGYKQSDFKNANEYYNSEVSIPMYHSLTQEEQAYVIETIRSFFR